MIAHETPATHEVDDLSDLVRASQLGDRQAFGKLFERNQGAVYALLYRRLGNHAEAEEVCQEVFLQAMVKIHQLSDVSCFAGWLRSIANRMAINRATRQRKPETPWSDEFETDCTERVTPLGALLAKEQQAHVQQGLRRLSKLDRESLVGFYFDDQSLPEMSHRLGTPLGTLKRRLHVARKRLAEELAPMGCT